MHLNDFGVPTLDIDDYPPPVCRCPKPVEHDPERRAVDRLAVMLGVEAASIRPVVRDLIDAAKQELVRELQAEGLLPR